MHVSMCMCVYVCGHMNASDVCVTYRLYSTSVCVRLQIVFLLNIGYYCGMYVSNAWLFFFYVMLVFA